MPEDNNKPIVAVVENYSLSEVISAALSKARDQANTPEATIVTRKLQEALMWHNEDQKNKANIAKARAMGHNPDVGSGQGPLQSTGGQ